MPGCALAGGKGSSAVNSERLSSHLLRQGGNMILASCLDGWYFLGKSEYGFQQITTKYHPYKHPFLLLIWMRAIPCSVRHLVLEEGNECSSVKGRYI
jgi:hypothetical protein